MKYSKYYEITLHSQSDRNCANFLRAVVKFRAKITSAFTLNDSLPNRDVSAFFIVKVDNIEDFKSYLSSKKVGYTISEYVEPILS